MSANPSGGNLHRRRKDLHDSFMQHKQHCSFLNLGSLRIWIPPRIRFGDVLYIEINASARK